jgi:ATP-dependent Lon protease
MLYESKDMQFEAELEDTLIDTLEENNDSKNVLDTPEEVFIFPLLRRPYFPGMAAPLVIEPGPFFDTIKLIAKSESKFIGLVLTKKETADIYKLNFDEMHTVGVLAKILRIIPMEQGGAQVILNMEKRLIISQPISTGKHLKAKVTYHEDDPGIAKELKAHAISILSTIKELLKLNPLFKEELQIFLGHSDFTEPGRLADFAVALTTAERNELQEVLDTFDVKTRIEKALILLKKELDVSQLQYNLSQKMDANIAKTQKDFFLREQLKTIKKELGIERDDKSGDREKFENRLKNKTVPVDIQTVINEEFEKLSALEPQSSEYGVCRNYLDWLTIVPWGLMSEENHNLKKAEEILAEDHYGLDDIKQRILEFIGVGKLSGGVKGSILCLVGPPGVGKTSIGKSIARALDRKFYRFSVGGMRDEAEIKGHRRTYIGAMPGKLIQALKLSQTMNPVIMLDEVDKMGSSYHGDPASALLEVLDPEQNVAFLDHYLDVRCDLSNVLFIVTANVLDTIPEPLKDRMEILRLSGYVQQEKIEIGKKFLLPKHKKEMGLEKAKVTFTDETFKTLINEYAREAGVRNLENQIKKILRKIAVKIVKEEQTSKKTPKSKPIPVTPKSLSEYLGKPMFNSDKFYEKTPEGVCMGLAWTAMGGATLYIETIKVSSEKTEMKLTGQAGDVMKESSEIAWSYLNSMVNELAPGHKFFEKSQVHIHIPEGATPKDGPSAGVTMVTALLSLLTHTRVKQNLAMTGELTLTGRVLEIGGVKEKIVAAKRSGVNTLIFPAANKRDIHELPEYIKKGLTIHFVEDYKEVFNIAFPKGVKKP